MASFKCVVCKATHPTVTALKACHMANNALIGDSNTKTVKKAVQTTTEKSYQLFTFETKEERDAFIQANPTAEVKSTQSRWVANPAGGSMQIFTYKVIVRK
jgi:hypothetical protein